MSVCVQKLNPILGENTWELQPDDYDFQQEIARSSFADMLHDTERNQMYYDAIKIAINKTHSLGKKANVLDIGTGTGLLSMMAVKCGADSVVACEAFGPISECARKVIALNGLHNKIKVVSKHSTELTVGQNGDLPEKVNILITEVFDTELIGEGAIQTFSHAQKVLLESDCIIVPHSATIYVQVVQSPFAQNWNRLKDIYSKDGQLVLQVPQMVKECPGSSAVHDIQLSQLSNDYFKEITQPYPILHFNWAKINTLYNSLENNIIKVKSECDGVGQVVFMWWELAMDMENKIILSCAPYWAHPLKKNNKNLNSSNIPWRDHWMQALYYLPKELPVKKGQELFLIGCHDQYSLWFNLVSTITKDSCINPNCECGLHYSSSRTLIGQLNDDSRNLKYLSVLQKYVNKESVVLCLSNQFYCGLAALKFGAKKVLYYVDSLASYPLTKDYIEANQLENVAIIRDVEHLQTHEDIKSVSLIIGQPNFSTTILPWDNLFFAYLIKKLSHSLSKNVVIAPRACSIKAVVVEFKDLQKIRLPIERFAEFNMKPFDDLILVSAYFLQFIKCRMAQ